MKSLIDPRMAGSVLGIGIDGLKDLLYRDGDAKGEIRDLLYRPEIDQGELIDLLYRTKPRQITPGELNDFFGGMDPGDLFGGK